MNRKLVILAFVAAQMVPGLGVAGGVTKEDFEEITRWK